MDLQNIDSATHTAAALSALAGMAGVLGDEATAARSETLAGRAQRRLEEAFWLEEEGIYGDMLATPAEMRQCLVDWRRQAEQHPERLGPDAIGELERLQAVAERDPEPERKRVWLLKNGTVILPLEAGLTDSGR